MGASRTGARMANSRMSNSGIRHNTYTENVVHNPSSFYRESQRERASNEADVNYSNQPSEQKLPSLKQITSHDEMPAPQEDQYEYYKKMEAEENQRDSRARN
jgi:alpha-galactosidase/6-phospho-beta-glucosidase family protein